jgi:hypothetical protein
MRRRSIVTLLATSAGVARLAWSTWAIVWTFDARIRDRYAIRSVPSLLRACGRDHAGRLPPDLDALAEHLRPQDLEELRTRVVMEPHLTVSGLLERRADLANSTRQPVRLREPRDAARSDCCISRDLLSVVEELASSQR